MGVGSEWWLISVVGTPSALGMLRRALHPATPGEDHALRRGSTKTVVAPDGCHDENAPPSVVNATVASATPTACVPHTPETVHVKPDVVNVDTVHTTGPAKPTIEEADVIDVNEAVFVDSEEDRFCSIDYSAGLDFRGFQDPRAEIAAAREKPATKSVPANMWSMGMSPVPVPAPTNAGVQTDESMSEDQIYEKLEHAFFVERKNDVLKRCNAKQEREMIKLRGELMKLRTKDAIMHNKMNMANEQLQIQSMRYNDLCVEIKQVVSMAACASMNPRLSPQRYRNSFAMFAQNSKTPKMPRLGENDCDTESEDSMTIEAGDIDEPVEPRLRAPTSDAIEIPGGAEPVTDIPRGVGAPEIRTAFTSPSKTVGEGDMFGHSMMQGSMGGFSYIDAMRLIMSPASIKPKPSAATGYQYGGDTIYGTTPLTNEQNDFKTIVANAEVNQMAKKIQVIENMYKQESDAFKQRIDSLEQHVCSKDQEILQLRAELARARSTIGEQQRVLESTKNVMNAFSYEKSELSGSAGSGAGSSYPKQRRVSGRHKVVVNVEASSVSPAAALRDRGSQMEKLGRGGNGKRRGYYSKIGVL